MATKVLESKNNRYTKVVADPNDPDSIPAFETSAGLKANARKKPVVVNKFALENFNANSDPIVRKNQLEAANVAALFAKKAIRPDEIAALRRKMFEVVADGMDDVAEVLKGTKQWNNVQVRLFSILTERVMPKLSTITVEDSTTKKLDDLSIEELEAIALGKKNHEAVDAVVKQGKHLDEKAEASESREFNAKAKKVTIKIASIDEAEKAFAATRRTPKVKREPVLKKKQSSPSSREKPSSTTSVKASDTTDAPSETSGGARE